MTYPAQKTFVDRYLYWGKVEERLSRFEHIRAQYTIDRFRECSEKGPFYCHYLAWRMGTWQDETLFDRFDDTLGNGALLRNWSSRGLPSSCGFDEYWGLIWELQVSEWLSDQENTNVEWMDSGPDLKFTNQRGDCFVECYTYRKSFGISGFIEELFGWIHPQIRVKHHPYMRFSLPQDGSRESFLDLLFRPYLDPSFLEAKLADAVVAYPVVLPTPKGTTNLEIYIDGGFLSEFVPTIQMGGTGDPELYLRNAVKEALNNKRDSNMLKEYHPNLLAVNFLLGHDAQSAFDRQIRRGLRAPEPDLGTTFDAVVLAVCGIDERFSMSSVCRWRIAQGQDHPIQEYLSPGLWGPNE